MRKIKKFVTRNSEILNRSYYAACSYLLYHKVVRESFDEVMNIGIEISNSGDITEIVGQSCALGLIGFLGVGSAALSSLTAYIALGPSKSYQSPLGLFR